MKLAAEAIKEIGIDTADRYLAEAAQYRKDIYASMELAKFEHDGGDASADRAGHASSAEAHEISRRGLLRPGRQLIARHRFPWSARFADGPASSTPSNSAAD